METAAASIDEAPFVDVLSPEFLARPDELIAKVRHESWLVRTPIGLLVIAREQVQRLLADPRLRSSFLDFITMQGLGRDDLYEIIRLFPLALDGPDHARIRRLVSRAFTPRAVDRLRPEMVTLSERLVDRFIDTGQCDFMKAFSAPFPIQIICELLGVPREDHPRFADWINAISFLLGLEIAQHLGEIRWGIGELATYVEGLLSDRRRDPGEDLVSGLVQVEDDGDVLSHEELVSLVIALLFGGYDTTRNQLGIALWLFCHHPDQWRALHERPDLVPPAVEEILRFKGIIDVVPRFSRESFEFDGYVIPERTVIALSTAAANNDESAYLEPRRFDITASREPQLTFGGGPHYCLGANLARAELQEALRVLSRRLPRITLAQEPEWRPVTRGLPGPERLLLAYPVS